MKGRGHHDNKHIRRGGVGENKEDGGLVIVYRRLLRASESNTELYRGRDTKYRTLQRDTKYRTLQRNTKYITLLRDPKYRTL